MQRCETLLPAGCKALSFRLSLNSDLELYIFQRVNTAQAQKQELEMDDMIIALVDHDRRLQSSEETKALAI